MSTMKYLHMFTQLAHDWFDGCLMREMFFPRDVLVFPVGINRTIFFMLALDFVTFVFLTRSE